MEMVSNAREESLASEVCGLERKCSELFSELKEARNQTRMASEKLKYSKSEKSLLEDENAALAKHVYHLEDIIVCRNCANTLENNSRPVNDVGTRQRQRKVKELLTTKAERALWFLDAYGVTRLSELKT